ncbi:hypothetical protein C4K35_4226 [Pseudomonas chlororaphis subsp. piscium]|nr:hypothetical protein C4K35_4226 [Pseudomonas chlororaphis subsp. piscium]
MYLFHSGNLFVVVVAALSLDEQNELTAAGRLLIKFKD